MVMMCCGQPARTYSRAGDKGRIVETLHCDNPECGSRILQRFVHFAEKGDYSGYGTICGGCCS